MLFTELKKIQDDDIEHALEERLKARGLDPAILHQSLGGSDVTVEELISDVVDGLIAKAVDANRESFRARQRKGFKPPPAYKNSNPRGGGGKSCDLSHFLPVYTEKKFKKWRPDFQPPFFDAFYYFCSDTGSLPSALAIRRLVK